MGSILTDADINILHDRCLDGGSGAVELYDEGARGGADGDEEESCLFHWVYVNNRDAITSPEISAKATLGVKPSVDSSSPRGGWWLSLDDVNEYFGEIEDILDATLPDEHVAQAGYETLREVIAHKLRSFKNTIVKDSNARGDSNAEKKLRILAKWIFDGETVGKNYSHRWTQSNFEDSGALMPLDNTPDPAYTIPLNFVFDKRLGDDAGAAFVVYANLLALHNALFGSKMLPLYGRHVWGTPLTARSILSNVKEGVNLLREIIRQEAIDEAADSGFSIGSLSALDKKRIVDNPKYRDYFSTTFNAGAITAVPLLYNFYLTAEYFQEINKSFESSKDRALDVIWSIIKNDNNFDNTPDMRRGASEVAIAASSGQDQTSAFNSAARDFILKMLIKTPIDILKGLTELIDPHVAVSKVIKTGSGFAFNELAKALDEPAKKLNAAITDDAPEIEPNVKGEDLVKLILCLAEFAMTTSVSMPGTVDDNEPDIPENFFPDISIDGIDFTGTVSGLLMIPPSPLGLLYLLLELIKSSDTNETINVSDVSNTKDC